MSQKRARIQVITLTIVTAIAAGHASALTFASFGFTGGTRFHLSGNTFTATETGSFTLTSGVVSPPGGYGPFAATMTLTGQLEPGTGSGLTFNATPNTTSVSQTIKSLNFTITSAGKNLLTGSLLTADGGQLSGASTGSLGASGTNADIAYTSDILNFAPGTRDMSFTLNNLSPNPLSVKGPTSTFPTFKLTQGDVNDFFADLSANFSADPVPTGVTNNGTVPEPGALALLCGVGVSGAAFTLRRRR